MLLSEEKLQAIQNYRRLRLLLNRLNVITNRPYWNCVVREMLSTQLGERKICLTYTRQPVDTIYCCYVNDNQVLFELRITKYDCWYLPFLFCTENQENFMTEEQAWLAIYELEQIIYKELERIHCNDR